MPVDLTADADLEKISLNWTQSNLKVDHEYRVYKDGELITATKKLSFEDFTTAGKFYCYEIKVVDKYDTEVLLQIQSVRKY